MAAVTPASRPARPGRRPVVLAWALWALAILGVGLVAWFDQLVRPAGRRELVLLDANGLISALAVLSTATVGAVLASRRPRHPVGWLLLLLGLAEAANGVTTGYATYGLLVRPGALPAAGYAAAYTAGSVIPVPVCIGFILLLTPGGSLPSPRWRPWAFLAAALPVVSLVVWALLPLQEPYQSVANPLAVAALGDLLEVVAVVTAIASLLVLPVGAWSLVVRFRRARGTERQQLRWVVLAAALASVAVAALLVGLAVEAQPLTAWAVAAFVTLPPLAIGAAVLRYRLYDLDRIISRTLAYGLLALILALGYSLVVLGLGQLLGQGSSLVVAAATLTVAAAFQPLRRRLRRALDRRFDRRRYHAAQTIQAFSARLRQQVDLDTLTAELLTVVDQTMQPTMVSLWLRPTVAASAKALTDPPP
jgi:hypothetical protein